MLNSIFPVLREDGLSAEICVSCVRVDTGSAVISFAKIEISASGNLELTKVPLVPVLDR